MKIILMLVMGLFLFNISCQNKSSNSGTTAVTTYYWNNGSCYASNTGQVVNSTLCNSTCTTGNVNNGYYWNNNYCYSSATGQVVNSTYCSSNANYNNNGAYYWNNNYCYASATGQVVNSTLCNSSCTNGTANNGYYWNNNYCYSSATGQVVNSTLCNGTNTAAMTTQCNGTYIYNQQYVTCNISNCSGYTLIEANSGRTVYCQ